MTLYARIKTEQLQARKNKDMVATALFSTLLSEVNNVSIEKKRDATDSEVVDIVKKFLKNNEIMILANPDNESLRLEKSLLETYLPTQMTDDEIKDVISSIHQSTNFGGVMKHFKENYSGRYDAKKTSEIAKTFFA